MKPNQQFITSLKSQPAITFNITATSPSIRTTIGDETLLQITGSGTITITGTGSARILVVGGGGAGSGGSLSANGNKGGGGGQVIDDYYTLTPGTYTTTVGLGGVAPAGNGGSSVVNSITPVAASGKGSGASGNLGNTYNGIFYPSSAGVEQVFFPGGTLVYVSGGGAGASKNIQTGPGGTQSSGSALIAGQGLPGQGEFSNITGGSIEYGGGGFGGLRAATASNTSGATNVPAGYINFPDNTPVNAEFASTTGGGGNGGARATTNVATPSAGARGVIIIRFRQI
jgi:hypothetical protein